jgi:hypothetical protein
MRFADKIGVGGGDEDLFLFKEQGNIIGNSSSLLLISTVGNIPSLFRL